MAADVDLSDQQLSYAALESLLTTLTLARRGNFSARMDGSRDGVEGEVVDAINELLEVLLESTTAITKLGQRVHDGQLSARIKVERAQGGLAEQVRAVNSIVAAFSDHTQELQLAAGQLELGDLSVHIDTSQESVHRAGDLRLTAESMNKLAAHLKRVTTEISRTVSAVGLEGRLNAQAHAGDVNGAWQVLVSAINAMNKSLFEQVSDLGDTARALAAGTFSARANVAARGDLQPIRNGLNDLGASVGGFCVGLRRIASELAQQGRLDLVMRQAPPAGDLLHAHEAANSTLALLTGALREGHAAVEQVLAGNLDPVLSVRDGDVGNLGRGVLQVADREKRTARGLSSILNGRFNELRPDGDMRDKELHMLGSRLKHEWLRATHGSLIAARDHSSSQRQFCQRALTCVAQTVGAAIGAYHVARSVEATSGSEEHPSLQRMANLGCDAQNDKDTAPGEGLVGRVALDRKPLLLTDLNATQVRIRTGVLEVTPRTLLLYPLLHDGALVAVIELAFTNSDGATALEVLDHVGPELARSTARLAQPSSTVSADVAAAKLSALEEELVIANARLETLGGELRARDQRIRALEAGRAA